ncbi:SDR family oxidoreductase [Levilactobacillus bambusae]|uniref:Oxidoreductase n=1 Tax=Levilactobacillus bambusae TaxID=2024736 RepID=A0A2V1N279_9LACO|nr:SDR family NAD(P)-dependent oxidoreductase [Levilactobacillus bambusae]PWG00415.1 oxidoreductase [Levilactobacillus bambusae]
MKLTHQTILITGGTSGIGLGLARQLQQMTNTVIITGRSQSTVTALADSDPNLIGRTVDVSSLESVKSLKTWVTANYPNLNVVINSAGIMRPYDLLDDQLDANNLTAEIQTNLIGTINMDKTFLTQLIAQPESLIVNVSSGLANLSAASHPIYSATKAGVHMFTDALREQLDYAGDTHVHVMELVPPLVAETNLESSITADAPNNMKLTDLVDEAVKGIESDSIRVNAGFAAQMRQAGQTNPDEAEHQMARQMLSTYFPEGL